MIEKRIKLIYLMVRPAIERKDQFAEDAVKMHFTLLLYLTIDFLLLKTAGKRNAPFLDFSILLLNTNGILKGFLNYSLIVIK